MAADETARRPATSATKLRLRWLLIVVAVMALLTAGWPLLNSAVANRQPLAAGSRLTVGTGPTSAVVSFGAGWDLLPEQSNPLQGYVLDYGVLQLFIRHVSLVGRDQVPGMWQGLRRTLSVGDPSVRLSRPAFVTLARGLRVMTGVVTTSRFVGTATIYPGPSGDFGIEMIVFAPRRASPALRAAAFRVITSLRFTVPGR